MFLILMMLAMCPGANAQTADPLDSLKRAYYAMPEDGDYKLELCWSIVDKTLNVDSSIIWAYRLLAIAESGDDYYYMGKANCVLSWAFMHSDYKAAIQYAKKSMDLTEKSGDLATRARNMRYLGLLYYLERDFGQSFIYLNDAIDLYNNLGDYSGVTECMRSIADNNFYLKKYDESDSILWEAVKIDQKHGNLQNLSADYVGIADSRNYKFEEQFSVADTLLVLEAKKYALKAYDYTLQDDRIYKLPAARCIVDVLLTDAEYLHHTAAEKADLLDSIGFFCNNFLDLAIDKGGARTIHRARIRKVRYYVCRGDFGNARLLIDSLEAFRRGIDLDDHEEYYWALIKYYEAIGEPQNAYNVYKLYFEMRINEANIALAVESTKVFEQKKYREKLLAGQRYRLCLRFGLIVLGLALAVYVCSFYRKRRYAAALAEKNKNITDSIKYASIIQNALMPQPELMEELFSEYFVIYRPLNIVSGDFYWVNTVGRLKIVVCADCTGHGVPGAFVSMLGVSLLNELVLDFITRKLSAADILNEMRSKLIKSFGQTKAKFEAGQIQSMDGMDLAMVIIDPDAMTLQYAGAYRPLWIWRDGQVIECKPDKMPIGLYLGPDRDFTNNVMEIRKGDMLYMFSDGIPDQFGYTGDDHTEYRHFTNKRLMRLIGGIGGLSPDEQKETIERKLDIWKNGYPQLDDNILIGIRI